MLALAADLLGVDPCGLVAVMAVGNQQLGITDRVLHGRDRARVGDPPEAIGGSIIFGRLAPRRVGRRRSYGAPRGARRIREQREDRREVRLRRSGQPETVLLRSRVRPLVGSDPARSVFLYTHAREEAPTGPPLPV